MRTVSSSAFCVLNRVLGIFLGRRLEGGAYRNRVAERIVSGEEDDDDVLELRWLRWIEVDGGGMG